MKRDSDATKARLLDAAIAEFAAYGIEAARLDRIALEARANKQLIYRYFGDKRALFDAVIHKTMTELAETIEVTPDDIPGYLDAMRSYHASHPHVLRLLMWEALEHNDTDVLAEPERQAHYTRKTERFRSAQEKGVIRSDIRPEYLTLILLGLALWPRAVPQLSQLITGETAGSDRIHAATVTLARQMLEPRR